MALAVDALEEFCKTFGRGKTIVHKYEPGTTWNHWIVPKRSKARDIRIAGPDEKTIVSKTDRPLALSPYSNFIDTKLDRTGLVEQTHTHEDHLETYAFYFARTCRNWEPGWNISLPKSIIDELPEEQYHVLIDTELTDEPMQLFECVVERSRPHP
jgi:aminopeptidase-like protein